MAKKKAAKKTSRKASKQPEMQTMPLISVHMANDILKGRKQEMEGSDDEIQWDGCLEDLWRALVAAYSIYGEKQVTDFLKNELVAIKRFYRQAGK